jgi:hypothetical protein
MRRKLASRRGEKIGWTAGWLGGFIWVAILSIIFLFQGKYELGLSGVALTGIAMASIYFCSPWRFPSTFYWKLMLAPYGIFGLSVAWVIWSYGGFESIGLDWWNLLWLLPLMMPLGSLSKRKWEESGAQQLDLPDHRSSGR